MTSALASYDALVHCLPGSYESLADSARDAILLPADKREAVQQTTGQRRLTLPDVPAMGRPRRPARLQHLGVVLCDQVRRRVARGWRPVLGERA